MADESNPTILQLQKFLQGTRPFGIGYGGPLDGKDNSDLVSTLNTLQSTFAVMLGEPLPEKLVSGNKSSPNAAGIISKYLRLKPPAEETPVKSKEPDQAPTQKDQNVLGLQQLLSSSLPVVGKLYSGPIDGQTNDEYKSALSKLAQAISKFVGKDIQKEVSATTADDIKEALTLIAEHQNKKQKEAEFTMDQRFVSMSQLAIELKSNRE